ncbi:MAG: UDP-glucose dehydrogenase family protein [Actinomycetota bacterium]
MNVTVIGVGHVGLVTAATLADYGHSVIGIDDDRTKIETLAAGGMPFYEPGLEDLLAKNVAAGRLRFTEDYAEAMAGAEVAFICVGTPPGPDGEANMVAVDKAATAAIKHAGGDLLLAQKSTVPVRTGDRLSRLAQASPYRILLASNPEFLREGLAVEDSIRPGRILVGADDEDAHRIMREIYRPFFEQGARYFATDLATAELAKHACNAFLAAKISFANALAAIAEAAGADVVKIADVMGADGRIGRAFLDAGPGYGGSCFPKDVAAFRAIAAKLGYEFGLLDEVMKINRGALDAAFSKIEDALWTLQDKKVLVAGLAFKEGTDDVRESPGLALALRLRERGASVVGHDPHAAAQVAAEAPGLQMHEDLYAAAEGAECLVVCFGDPRYTSLDLVRLKGVMDRPLIVDLRNILDPEAVANAGFSYIPTGRPSLNI